MRLVDPAVAQGPGHHIQGALARQAVKELRDEADLGAA